MMEQPTQVDAPAVAPAVAPTIALAKKSVHLELDTTNNPTYPISPPISASSPSLDIGCCSQDVIPSMPISSEGTYEDAIRILKSRSPNRIEAAGGRLNVPQFQRPGRSENILRFMHYWFNVIGYPHPGHDLDILNVTGTKGKGSTSAFTMSFLGAHSEGPVGLFTTPHMLSFTERIRIDGVPVPRSVFADAVHRVWNCLLREAQTPTPMNPHVLHPSTRSLPQIDPDDTVRLPVLPDRNQLITLVSYDIFVRHGVRTAVYEVFCGGRVDSTNAFERTCASVFTPIGVDHEKLLGSRPLHVAWHKSGIMRPHTPVLVGPQSDDEARIWLEWNAGDLDCPIEFPTPLDPAIADLLPASHPKLWPSVQLWNAALAVRVAGRYLESKGQSLTKDGVAKGLDAMQWDGRFQVVKRPEEPAVTWFFDSAHNTMSLPVAAEWYAMESARQLGTAADPLSPPPSRSSDQMPPAAHRVLVFGFDPKRDPTAMSACLFDSFAALGISFELVVLSPFDQHQDANEHIAVAEDQTLAGIRQRIPEQKVVVTASMAETLRAVAESGNSNGAEGGKQVFVLGSFHLVAGIWAEWQGCEVE